MDGFQDEEAALVLLAFVGLAGTGAAQWVWHLAWWQWLPVFVASLFCARQANRMRYRRLRHERGNDWAPAQTRAQKLRRRATIFLAGLFLLMFGWAFASGVASDFFLGAAVLYVVGAVTLWRRLA